MVVIEAIILEDDQSCQALNPAWTTKTTTSRMARARLDGVGGESSDFHEMKHEDTAD